jgi:hypothetical protein
MKAAEEEDARLRRILGSRRKAEEEAKAMEAKARAEEEAARTGRAAGEAK